MEKAVKQEHNFATNSQQLYQMVESQEKIDAKDGDEGEAGEDLELELSCIVVHDQFQAAQLENMLKGQTASS